MGAGFGAVYVREPSNWWALIPCGVMLTLSLVVALPPAWEGMPVAAVLFLGLAATFAALSLVPGPTGTPPRPPGALPGHTGQPGATAPARMKWPLIPAAVLAVMGLIFTLQATVLLMPANSSFRGSCSSPARPCWSTRTATAPARHHGKVHGLTGYVTGPV